MYNSGSMWFKIIILIIALAALITSTVFIFLNVQHEDISSNEGTFFLLTKLSHYKKQLIEHYRYNLSPFVANWCG